MPATSQTRFIRIDTPLGEDKLLVRSFTGREEISRLFSFQLDLLSTDSKINAKDIIGQNVTLTVLQADGITERYFNGYISRFARLPSPPRLSRYRAEMVPWLWFLTRTADCRILQEKTVPESIEETFKRFDFSEYEIGGIKGQHDKWEYCVQYRETAFNFVQRLMEQEGIFYFFRHEVDKHVMVMGDQKSVHKPCEYQPTVRIEPSGGTGFYRTEDTIQHWEHQWEFRPGKWAQTDYNFETPSTSLLANTESIISLPDIKNYEVFDYPGEYENKSEGEALTRIRMEEEEVPYDIVIGSSDCRSFTPGGKFTLADHDRRSENTSYVLTSISHRAKQAGVLSEDDPEDTYYTNNFTCIPDSVIFRPARSTPKPLVQGTQTAIVVGPKGEEIYTDKYGRVKVQFHWDRVGKYNEKSSCWIRVATPWAGNTWGWISIPRMGQEVLVDFLEGDPDRPVIIGRLYHAEQMPPYVLPNWQTYSTWKSNSYKGGGGYNEIRYYDYKGKEQIYIHAQWRMDIRVRHSFYETCGGSRHIVVGGDSCTTVSGDCNFHTKKGLYNYIEGKLNECVKADVVYDYQSNCATLVKTKCELNAQQIIIEASQKISLKVGGNFIMIDPSGVTIYGTMVKINSGGWGTETGDPDFDDAMDAETADTGEPGYLDKYRGDGHGRKWKRRKLHSQHYIAPPRPGEDARVTAVRNTLQHSAAGRHALEVYDRFGLNPTFTPGPGTTYNAPNGVNFDPTDPDTALSMVHEMNHAQHDHEGTSPDINNPNRADYVDGMLKEEAESSSLENKAARELRDAGQPPGNPTVSGPYDRGYQKGVDDEKRRNPNATPAELDAAGHQAGQQGVLDDFRAGRVTTSTPGNPPYTQYYGDAWDGQHPGAAGGGGGGGAPGGGGAGGGGH